MACTTRRPSVTLTAALPSHCPRNAPLRRPPKEKRRILRELRLLLSIWSRCGDSNPRPADYESAALPAELHRPAVHFEGKLINPTPPLCQDRNDLHPLQSPFFLITFRADYPGEIVRHFRVATRKRTQQACHEQSKGHRVELPQLGRGRSGQLHAQLERDAASRGARREDPLGGEGRRLRSRRHRDFQRGPEKRRLLPGGRQRRRGRSAACGRDRRADPHPEPLHGTRDRRDHQVQPHPFRFRPRVCPGAPEKG